MEVGKGQVRAIAGKMMKHAKLKSEREESDKSILLIAIPLGAFDSDSGTESGASRRRDQPSKPSGSSPILFDADCFSKLIPRLDTIRFGASPLSTKRESQYV